MKNEKQTNEKPSWLKRNRRPILAVLSVIVVSICLLAFFAVQKGREKLRKMRLIQEAINNPANIDPEKLLGQIDDQFRGMSREKKEKVLKDPVKVEAYVEKATYRELSESFGLLFKLPRSIRQKIIRDSAENLRKRAEVVGDKKIDQFIDSSMGKGALRGAARYFFLELKGTQKAEVAELTDVVTKIIHRRTALKRGEK